MTRRELAEKAYRVWANERKDMRWEFADAPPEVQEAWLAVVDCVVGESWAAFCRTRELLEAADFQAGTPPDVVWDES